MDLSNKQVVQALLAKFKIGPKKSFGQNFLVDRSVLDLILKTAGLSSRSGGVEPSARNVGVESSVENKRAGHVQPLLEIGPGIGTLTVELLKYTNKLVAVEADHEMVGILQKITEMPSNLTIIPTTIQHFRRQDYFQDGQYKVVANIPYNISSYLLNDYLQNSPRPSEMILMMQKKVAQRAIAKSGDSERSLLSLVVELFSEKAEIVQIVHPSAFWPEPKVESAILKIIVDPNVETQGIASVQSILKIAKIAFSQRRKKIANSLPVEMRRIASLRSDIDLNLRPQDLTLVQWKIISTL